MEMIQVHDIMWKHIDKVYNDINDIIYSRTDHNLRTSIRQLLGTIIEARVHNQLRY